MFNRFGSGEHKNIDELGSGGLDERNSFRSSKKVSRNHLNRVKITAQNDGFARASHLDHVRCPGDVVEMLWAGEAVILCRYLDTIQVRCG